MARTRRKALWGALQTGGYDTDPSANGSGYTPWPCDVLPDLADKKEPLPTTYQTGDNWDTELEEGPDGWELSGVELPLIGLATAAGDGVDASTVTADWLNDILTHVLGATLATTPGEGVASIGGATAMTLDGDVLDLYDLVPVYEAGVPALPRTQWEIVTVDPADNSYTIAPGFADYGTVPPTGAAVVYGVKRYTFDDDGGVPMAFVYRDDGQDYTLLGGRCTSMQIRIPAGGGRVKLVTSWRGNTKTAESKASLPAAVVAPAITPIRGVRSPVWFNGTNYGSAEITIDFGISAAEIQSTAGSEGRAGDEHVFQAPMVTIRPQYTNAINNLKRNVTKGRLLVQIGGGILSGGVLNTCAVHFDQAQAMVVTRTDDNGVARQEVQFKASNPGAGPHIFQFCRA